MSSSETTSNDYKKDSLSLRGSVAMGTGVMIGAGIFALTGQVAELAGKYFPLAFLAAAVVAGFSAYSYTRLAKSFPSAGGIAMFLMKAYGKGTATAGFALLMYFSMVINESLVARTFGTYVLELFGKSENSLMIPTLGVGLLVLAFIINILGNKFIGRLSLITAVIKIVGILIFACAGLWVSGLGLENLINNSPQEDTNFLAATALSLLAYKGFTTITNSGSELKDPKTNIAKSIVISLVICAVVYFLVALAVASNLSIPEIINHRDYALAEAARPLFGKYGLWFTAGLAIIATVSGLIASTFAVSRMLAMLAEMNLVPDWNFGISGRTQKHTLVYTVIFAIILTILFDLSRIATLGAIFYIIMDIAIHWGVFKYLRKEVEANSFVLISAIVLDVLILGSLVLLKMASDPLVLWVCAGGIIVIFGGEKLFLFKKA